MLLEPKHVCHMSSESPLLTCGLSFFNSETSTRGSLHLWRSGKLILLSLWEYRLTVLDLSNHFHFDKRWREKGEVKKRNKERERQTDRHRNRETERNQNSSFLKVLLSLLPTSHKLSEYFNHHQLLCSPVKED